MHLQIIHLRPDGSYTLSKGKVNAGDPNHVHTKIGSSTQAFQLVQDPVFQLDTPVRYDTWEEFVAASPPPLNPRVRRRVMATAANYEFPLSSLPPLSWADKHAFGMSQDEEIVQSAAVQATREDGNLDTSRKAMLVMTAAIMVLVIMLAIPMVKTLGWVGDQPPTPVERVASSSELLRRTGDVCTEFIPVTGEYISVACSETGQ